MSIYISSNQENLSNFIKTGYDIIIKILKVFFISCITIFGLAVLIAALLTTLTPLWPALPHHCIPLITAYYRRCRTTLRPVTPLGYG